MAIPTKKQKPESDEPFKMCASPFRWYLSVPTLRRSREDGEDYVYSSLFMRQVCFSMCMVARSVELVSTSRTSSCRSSSVSASRARFFSCISICEHALICWSDYTQGLGRTRTTQEQDTNKRWLNTYRGIGEKLCARKHVDHMWRGVKMRSRS